MKSEKSLEEKINEIKTKLPEVKSKLEYENSSLWGFSSTYEPQDVEYLKIGDYQIVGIKILTTNWDSDKPVSKWHENVVLGYKKGNDELKWKYFEAIKTRGDYEYQDSPLKGKYHFVKLEYLGNKEVKISWADQKGDEGPSHKVILE